MKQIFEYFICFLIIFSITQNIFAIDTVSTKYMPLKTGNFFVYAYAYIGPGGSGGHEYKTTIVRDSVFNSHRYFLLVDSDDLYSRWVRVDSNNGNYMQFDPAGSCNLYNHEALKDSLAVQTGNSYHKCNSSQTFTCGNIAKINVFPGDTATEKPIIFMILFYENGYSYARNFGFVSSYNNAAYGGYSHTELKGCRVNGVIHGDTSVVPIGITPLINEIPERYSLHQNYPNPFNPSTFISFDILKLTNVQLIIYDITGREITKIVDANLQPGTYKTIWLAKELPSGVYYYTLSTSDYKETRKMVLLK